MKKTIFLIATVLLLASSTFASFAAGWGRDEVGYWYLLDSYTYARDQIVTIDGVNYGFDRQAYMATGWLNLDSNWYYFNPESGAQMLGWVQSGGKWYYLDPGRKGAMHKSWLILDKDKYYLDESGAMLTGAFVVDGWYYFAEADGRIKRNTTETSGSVTIRYDDEGKQWYKNAETDLLKVGGASGDDLWLPVYEDSLLTEQREWVMEGYLDTVDEVEYELYINFKTVVTNAKTSKERDEAIAKWKKTATNRLKKLLLEQEEIDDYIEKVVAATYDDDEGRWTYTSRVENADGTTTTNTYTYWGRR